MNEKTKRYCILSKLRIKEIVSMAKHCSKVLQKRVLEYCWPQSNSSDDFQKCVVGKKYVTMDIIRKSEKLS
jgi:hypothetical protein